MHSFIFTLLSHSSITNIYWALTMCQAPSLLQGGRRWSLGPWGEQEAERLTEQGQGTLQSMSGEGVCGSGQRFCLIFSLPPAENAAASAHKRKRNWAAMVPFTQAHQHFGSLSLSESSLTLRKWLVCLPEKVASLSPSLSLMMVSWKQHGQGLSSCPSNG